MNAPEYDVFLVFCLKMELEVKKRSANLYSAFAGFEANIQNQGVHADKQMFIQYIPGT